MLYNHRQVDLLLGCMVKDTSLANSSKYPLCPEDFKGDKESLFQLYLYGVLFNLNANGIKRATRVDIDNMLMPHTAKYNTFIDEGGLDRVETIYKLAKVDNFEGYYNNVRKMSCLRDAKEDGDNISEFWDDTKSDEDNYAKLDGYTLENIIDYFKQKALKKERKYLVDKDDDTTRKKAGDNGHKILESFKECPMLGLSFESKYLTTLWDGFRKGQLYIRSGDTSSGKSRSVIGDLANVCANEIYDMDNNKWVENPNGNNRGLYIGCEMELDSEVDPLMWAYLSGVESSLITKGKFDNKQQKLVDHAIDIVNNDSIWLTDMPSFNIQKLEEEIAFHKKEFNIDYVAFDYILLNNALIREFVESRGKSMGMRGDEVILELSKALKDMCKKYDIGMISASQVNADIKDFRMRDYQVLRGGKAMADKATGGSISMPITAQELKLVEPYLDKYRSRGFGNNDFSNLFVETVYKSRFSEYPKECKIFSDYNLGNMRRRELFVTDKDFKPIQIEKTQIIITK